MARRPTGPKATPEAAAKGGVAVQPGVSAKPRGSARAEGPELGVPPAAGRPRLVALRLAAAALALEAAGLAVAGVFAAISTVDGHAYQLAGGIAATLIALATASGVAAIAVALANGRPWTRIPTAMTQLFVIIAGVTLLQGNRPEWGAPALALAVTCLAGLATPASLRALNRPPAEHANDAKRT
jgi:hypothetical protein